MGKALDVVKSGVTKKIGNVEVVKNGIVKQITKVYSVVGGITKLVWEKVAEIAIGTISKTSTTLDPLSVGRRYVTGGSIGNYTLFAGGYSSGGLVVDTYSSSLVKGVASELNNTKYKILPATVGNYLLFGGGYKTDNSGTTYKEVEVYNASLTKSSASALTANTSTNNAVSASVKNYAVFVRTDDGVDTGTPTGDVYDSSLSRKSINSLSNERYNVIGCNAAGKYALFAGGDDGSTTPVGTVDVYDNSLVQSTASNLSVARSYIGATSLGDYAIFAGGRKGGGSARYSAVDAYDSSLTRITLDDLNEVKCEITGISVGNYALFGGGMISTSSYDDVVDIYDVSLTKTTGNFDAARRYIGEYGAASVGNYAIFAGGQVKSVDSYSDVVEAFKFTP